jgi:Peptidase family M23
MSAAPVARMSAAPLIAAVLLAVFASPAGAAWRPPVDGALTRPFAVTTNPFAAGQHRGIDLRAAPGTPVRAPCAGRVVVAGRVGTSGGVVALLCGRWRVTHLPLTTITVHAGTSVRRGAELGTVARSVAHPGLHLGVRRAGKRFGYVDPLRFLIPTPTAPLPPLGRAPRTHRDLSPPAPRVPAPRSAPTAHLASPLGAPLASPLGAPLASPTTAPLASPLSAPLAAPRLARSARGAGGGPGGIAPWPAWLGLALVLAGAGVRWRGGIRTRTRRQIRSTARLSE